MAKSYGVAQITLSGYGVICHCHGQCIMNLKDGIVGAGAMGGALLNGWIDGGVMDPARSAIFEPAAGADLHALSARVGFALNPPADPSMVGPNLGMSVQHLVQVAWKYHDWHVNDLLKIEDLDVCYKVYGYHAS